MKQIRTSKGFEILVDDEDFAVVSQFTWQVELRGRVTKKPRVYTKIGGRKRRTKVYLSRMLMREPPCQVDHENGDTLDHQRRNLRPATAAQNSRNSVKHHARTSRFKGVSRRRSRLGTLCKKTPWVAHIRIGRKRHRIGIFSDEIAAARAYDREALEYFGEFARPNFP